MDVIDRIYEAALVPDAWNDALAGMAAISGATISSMFLFDELGPPRGVAFNIPKADLDHFLSKGWTHSPSVAWALANLPAGFTVAADHLTAEQWANDEAEQALAQLGTAPPIVTNVRIGTTEIMSLLVAQPRSNPRSNPDDIRALNALRPHFARSAIVASRLGFERARATVGILEGLGLAAAVIDRRGRVIASNGLLDKQEVVVATAFGGVALSNRVKNAAFAQALSRTGEGTHGPCLSMPLTATDTDPALIVHLLPLRGLANDLFSGGHVLMVVSPVVRKAVPQPELLYGLFDLTPAEARLTLSLLEGGALPEIAVRTGVSHHTLRTQLRSVMAKTGTRRQAELTQLLAAL